MTILLALVYSATLVAIALGMYRGWRQEQKCKEFRDYIRRTYGRDGDKKYWYEPGHPGDR
jgi:hypothetical protein